MGFWTHWRHCQFSAPTAGSVTLFGVPGLAKFEADLLNSLALGCSWTAAPGNRTWHRARRTLARSGVRNCDLEMYQNPVPVAVCLLPVENQLLGVRRGIEPRKGFVALPGGYINRGETWQEACCRELHEETGLSCEPNEISLYAVENATDSNRLLIFGLAPRIERTELQMNFCNEETEGLVLISPVDELAFPLHTLVSRRFFRR